MPSFGRMILTALAVSVSVLAPFCQSCWSQTVGLWGSYSNRVTDVALQNPFVHGVMVSVSWRQIQRDGEDMFNWSKVDEQIDNATAAGKDITLVLHAGGQNTPDWVKDTQGVQLITIIDTSNTYSEKTYCQPITVPVFWDPVFLELKKKFIAAAGKRYAANANISGVMVSFANFITSDWNVPHDIDYTGKKCGIPFNQIRDWKSAGYSTGRMFAAGKETIDAWAEAFPGKALKLPIHPTHKNLEDNEDGTPATASKLAEKIIKYGYETYPEQFYAQLNTLNAQTPHASQSRIIKADPNKDDYILRLLKEYPNRIGFQLLSAASNGYDDNCRLNQNKIPCHPYTVLINSVKAAFSYKPRYIELWYQDVENSSLNGILRAIFKYVR